MNEPRPSCYADWVSPQQQLKLEQFEQSNSYWLSLSLSPHWKQFQQLRANCMLCTNAQAGRQMEIGNWQLAQVKTKLWQLASTSLCSISLFSRCWNIAYGGDPPGGRLLRPLPRLFFTCSPHFFLQNVFLIYPLAEEKTWVRNFISSTQNRLVYLGEVEVERFDYAKENRSTAHTHIVMQV